MLLVVDAVLFCHVCKGDEHGACAAGRVAHTDIAVLLHRFIRSYVRKLQLRHKFADMVGRKELPFLFLLQVHVMVQAAQKILFRVLLQRQHHKPQHLRESFLLLFPVAIHDGEVCLLPLIFLRPRHHIRKGYGGQDKEIRPDLPSGVPESKFIHQGAEFLSVIPFLTFSHTAASLSGKLADADLKVHICPAVPHDNAVAVSVHELQPVPCHSVFDIGQQPFLLHKFVLKSAFRTPALRECTAVLPAAFRHTDAGVAYFVPVFPKYCQGSLKHFPENPGVPWELLLCFIRTQVQELHQIPVGL